MHRRPRQILAMVLGAGCALGFAAHGDAAEKRAVPRLASFSGTAISERRPALAPFSYVLFCKRYPRECDRAAGSPGVGLTQPLLIALDGINREVNRAIRPERERGRGVEADRWVIYPKAGDCDDYAVTKRHLLIAAGVPAGALRIAVVLTPEREGHAVLVVRTDRGDLVLDNRTDRILDWRKTGLTFIKLQSSHPRFWSAV